MANADRLVTLQNANGSWDWVVTNATGPTATTYYNVTGVTAQGLLDAYALTKNPVYLTAAENAGNYIIGTPISTSQRQNAYNVTFLYDLATASGLTTYSTGAQAILTNIFTQENYWSDNNANNCTTSGCTVAQLVAADENYRGSTDGIVAWDLEPYIRAEIKAGNTPNAQAIATAINAYVNDPGYTTATPDYELGLAAAIRANQDVGTDAVGTFNETYCSAGGGWKLRTVRRRKGTSDFICSPGPQCRWRYYASGFSGIVSWF